MKRNLAGWWIILPCIAALTLGCHTSNRTSKAPDSTAASVASASGNPGDPTVVPTPAPQFELADQFGATHQFRFPRDKVTVVTICGRKGSDDVEPWTQALGQRFGDTILLQGVADVGGVPGFMRGLIRTMFRKDVKYPVMLDWAGTQAAAFQYDRQTVTVCVVDRAGVIVHRVSGPARPETLGPVMSAIEKQLAAPPPDKPSP